MLFLGNDSVAWRFLSDCERALADLKPVYWDRILESCKPSLPARREATKALGQRL